MKSPRFAAPLFRLARAALTLLAAPAFTALAVTPNPASTARVLPIAARAFAGSSVNVVANVRQTLFTHGTTQYAGFYDADGFMVLARRALGDDTWQTRRTAYRAHVADAHNSISLAVDGAGYLHVAWDHHANPLNYARAVAPGSLELAAKSPMTGRRETSVTYPQFFLLPDGDLLALYRDGASGNGSLVLNRYAVATGQWSTVQSNLIDGERKRSPYWSMVVDGRGALQLVWTWRDSPDVATNHDLAYARSTDGGLTWVTAAGAALALPLTAENCDYAVRIPTHSNLMNSPTLAVDAAGHPCLTTYWSPTPNAAPRFNLVRYDGKVWQVIPGPAAAAPFTLAGTATKHPPLSRAVLLADSVWKIGPLMHLIYRDDARGSRVIAATCALDTGTWTDVELTEDGVGAWEPSFDPVAWDRLKQFHALVQAVRQTDGDDRTAAAAAPTPIGSLIWSPEALRRAHPVAAAAAPAPTAGLDQPPDAAAVLALAERAADWQLANPPDATRYPPRGWERAPFYIGALALDRIAPDRRYRDAILKQAEANAWRPGDRLYHADDHCVIQAYLELYHETHDPRMLAPARARFDAILAHPSPASLDWNSPGCQDRWSWCDALFMDPVAWLELWRETGDRRYLDHMNREWWATTAALYRPAIGFYFRDESYLDVREPNGKTVHWSRGNGWVFAGLARVLDLFPKDHPDYPRYVQLYREMAAAVLAAQQPDGLWRVGLLDPAAHPARETSGSGFYTFGLAWGVNRGLLDRATVAPRVRRAWNALALCVRPDGKVEHVQPIGAAPEGFDPHHTEPFGVGAFLLAATEVHTLAK